jgi:hypothetical protein
VRILVENVNISNVIIVTMFAGPILVPREDFLVHDSIAPWILDRH